MMDAALMKLRSPRILVALTAAVIVVAFAAVSWRYTHPARIVNWPYVAALVQIKRMITHPQTAIYSQFGRDPRARAYLRHDGDYEVTGWVEQSDDSGRRVRLYWLCVLHPQGGNHYLPVYVHLGEVTAGTYVRDNQ